MNPSSAEEDAIVSGSSVRSLAEAAKVVGHVTGLSKDETVRALRDREYREMVWAAALALQRLEDVRPETNTWRTRAAQRRPAFEEFAALVALGAAGDSIGDAAARRLEAMYAAGVPEFERRQRGPT